MPSPLEHDYIGFSSSSSNEEDVELEDLKGTELRLGLPGSEFPERKPIVGLSLGLPKSSVSGLKRGFADTVDGSGSWIFSGGGGGGGGMENGKTGSLVSQKGENDGGTAGQENKGHVLSAKAQVVGWPPIQSYRRSMMPTNLDKNKDGDEEKKQVFGCVFVKVSMDGAPYLRKVDLKSYDNYKELSSALETMFSCFTIGQCTSQGVPGKDGLSQSCLADLLHGSEYALTYEDKDGDWMLVGDVPWDMFTNSCRRLRIMKGSDAIGLAPRGKEKRKNRNAEASVNYLCVAS